LDQQPLAGQGFIAMADVVTEIGVVRLAAPKTHDEFAQILYSALRAADEQGLETVVVEQPLGGGIAVAIRDRLKRAANGR
jgi:L-threonylcarbamoyladenylate synthase